MSQSNGHPQAVFDPAKLAPGLLIDTFECEVYGSDNRIIRTALAGSDVWVEIRVEPTGEQRLWARSGAFESDEEARAWLQSLDS